MNFLTFSRILTGTGFLFCLVLLFMRLRGLLALPYKPELAPVKGNVLSGLIYAFTLGMAPWAKESTRLHLLTYLRGLMFHIAIFLALAILPLSFILPPFGSLRWLPAMMIGLGALAGVEGFFHRLLTRSGRVLSTPDDLASVALVSLFLITAFGSLWAVSWLPFFYLVSAILFFYLPFSKIRHFLYFFFSRYFFAVKYSQRGAIGWSKVNLEL